MAITTNNTLFQEPFIKLVNEYLQVIEDIKSGSIKPISQQTQYYVVLKGYPTTKEFINYIKTMEPALIKSGMTFDYQVNPTIYTIHKTGELFSLEKYSREWYVRSVNSY